MSLAILLFLFSILAYKAFQPDDSSLFLTMSLAYRMIWAVYTIFTLACVFGILLVDVFSEVTPILTQGFYLCIAILGLMSVTHGLGFILHAGPSFLAKKLGRPIKGQINTETPTGEHELSDEELAAAAEIDEALTKSPLTQSASRPAAPPVRLLKDQPN